MTGNVEPHDETLDLAAFARIVDGDADRDLTGMLEDLDDDPFERIVVDELARQLERDKTFREPIVVTEDEHGRRVIADGRHRVAAHYRTGYGPIRVTYRHTFVDSETITVGFMIVDGPADEMPLRSFPVEDTWATADVAATTTTVTGSDGARYHEVHYHYHAPGATPEAVAAAALRHARTLDMDVTVTSVSVDD